MELFNTLGGKLETLEPVGAPELRMYCCGPTVYDYGHIGNFRTFLHVDVLRRFLRQQGMAVKFVMNITDVDDKIIRNAAAAGKPIADYTEKYERAFFEDSDALGIERPEIVARATACIPDMVTLIEKLASEDIAYQTEDGAGTSGSRGFPSMGSSRAKTSTGSKTARALTSMSMRRTRLGILRYGRHASRESRAGRRRWAAEGRAGISSARRWRRSSWESRWTCTAAAKT